MTFRSSIRDGGIDKNGLDAGPKFCVGLIVSNGEQGVSAEHRRGSWSLCKSVILVRDWKPRKRNLIAVHCEVHAVAFMSATHAAAVAFMSATHPAATEPDNPDCPIETPLVTN